LRSGREKDLEDVVLLMSKVEFNRLRKLVDLYMGDYYVEELDALKEISDEVGKGFSVMRLKKFKREVKDE
jgi:hypothetical protein